MTSPAGQYQVSSSISACDRRWRARCSAAQSRPATAAPHSASRAITYDRLAAGSGAYLLTTTSTSASMRARRAAAPATAGAVLGDGVHADAGVAAGHAQQSLVMHRLEHVRRRARRSAPVVGHPCRARNARRLRAGAPCRARARTPAALRPACWRRWATGRPRGCISACTRRVTKP